MNSGDKLESWGVAQGHGKITCISIRTGNFFVFENTKRDNQRYTRWSKYDRDYLCVNKSQFVPVIFEPACKYLLYSNNLVFRQFILFDYRSNTIHNTHSHTQLYHLMIVTGFDYLFAIIRPKTCGSKIKRNHINTVTSRSQINTSDNYSVDDHFLPYIKSIIFETVDIKKIIRPHDWHDSKEHSP
jgi:hypothetical protein